MRTRPLRMRRVTAHAHFQKCIRFDPLLTGQVIRRMRSGLVRIFYGDQWEPL